MSTDELAALLDRIDAASEKATPGEWWVEPEQASDTSYVPARVMASVSADYWSADCDEVQLAAGSPSDAEFIADARTSLPLLSGAVRRALTLHSPIEWQEFGADGMPDLNRPLPTFCRECTDREWVDAIEHGDGIDAAADVVLYPCATVAALTGDGQ